MSFAPSLLECDRCMASFPGNAFLIGRPVYVLSTGVELPVQKELGWCHQCQGTAAIEDLDPAKLEQELQDSRNRRLASESELKDRLRVLFRRPRSDIESLNKIERTLAQTIVLQTSRHNDPRCLTCGSQDVLALPSITADLSGRPVNTGFVHPGCIGRLWHSFSPDMRLMMTPKRVAYDAQGRRLSDDMQSVPA